MHIFRNESHIHQILVNYRFFYVRLRSKFIPMKKTITTLLFAAFCLTAAAQQKLTFEYAVKDTNHLKLDVYVPEQQNEQHSCLVFAFGGGFIGGARDDKQIPELMQHYTQQGWVVVSIDYRLGMKGMQSYGMWANLEKYEKAIEMAGEDMISATDYILKNLLKTPQFTIDPNYIVLVGSSAGAITILQADYFLGNRIHGAELLPDTFRYAGLMPFSGFVFSRKGKVKYRVQSPAPTLFCHGTSDQLVTYKKIQLANLCVNGSSSLAKIFKKNNYPYHIKRYVGIGHDVAGYFKYEFNLMDEFIDQYVFCHKQLQIDETYYDPNLKSVMKKNFKPKDMKGL